MLIIDLIYPLLDPASGINREEQRCLMFSKDYFATIKDLRLAFQS